jgi:hypothetical protein
MKLIIDRFHEIIKNFAYGLWMHIYNGLLEFWEFIVRWFEFVTRPIFDKLIELVPFEEIGLTSRPLFLLKAFRFFNYYLPVRELLLMLSAYCLWCISVFTIRNFIKASTLGQY